MLTVHDRRKEGWNLSTLKILWLLLQFIYIWQTKAALPLTVFECVFFIGVLYGITYIGWPNLDRGKFSNTTRLSWEPVNRREVPLKISLFHIKDKTSETEIKLTPAYSNSYLRILITNNFESSKCYAFPTKGEVANTKGVQPDKYFKRPLQCGQHMPKQ